MITRDAQQFQHDLEKIDRIIDRQAELPHQVFRSKPAGVRFIDFDELWSDEFFEVLKRLTAAVGGSRVGLAVLKPDPMDYYHAHFHKFPFLEFEVSSATGSAYLEALHEDPGDSPADAIVHNSDVLVIFPENMRWLLYGDRALEVGVIGAMDDDALQKVDSTYPQKRLFSASSVIDQILPTVFRGTVPAEVRAQLLRNYDSREG
jgi:hypothetical protein